MITLGDVGGGPGEDAGDRRRFLAGRAEVVERPDAPRLLEVTRPGLERLIGGSQALAADPPLEPVDRSRTGSSGTAKERDDCRRRALAGGDLDQLEQGCAGRRRGQRDARLGRQRNAHPPERAGDQRCLAIGAADHDRDLIGIDAVGEQARDLAADQLRFAMLSGRFEELQRPVGLDPLGVGLEEVALEMVEHGS